VASVESVAEQVEETPLGFSWPRTNQPLPDGALELAGRRRRPLRVERSKPVVSLGTGPAQATPRPAGRRALRNGAHGRAGGSTASVVARPERLEELASTVSALRNQLAGHERQGHEAEGDALREVRALRSQVHRMLVDRAQQQARMQRDLQALSEAVRTLRRSPGIGKRGVDLDASQIQAIGAAVARQIMARRALSGRRARRG
jgi:hypothetical protein